MDLKRVDLIGNFFSISQEEFGQNAWQDYSLFAHLYIIGFIKEQSKRQIEKILKGLESMNSILRIKINKKPWIISLNTVKYFMLFFAFIPPESVSKSAVMNPIQALIKLIACIWVLLQFVKKMPRQKEFYLLCGYYVLLLISTVMNPKDGDLLQAILISFGNMCFVYTIIFAMKQDQDRFLDSIGTYLTILLIINFFVQFYFLLSGNIGTESFISTENHQGVFYLFSLLIYFLCRDHSKKCNLLLVFLLLNLALSSGTTLKLLVVAFFLIHFLFRPMKDNIRSKKFYAKIVFVTLVVMFFSLVVFRVQEKIVYSKTFTTIIGDVNTFTGRNQIWEYSLNMFLERPYWLLGYGQIAGSFVPAAVISSWSSAMLGTHNDFLNRLIMAGPLALILWCIFIYRGFMLLPQGKTQLRRDCMVLMACMVIQLMMDNANTELMAPMIFIIANLSMHEKVTLPLNYLD